MERPLVVHLLRVVSLPHWAEHRVRTTLTAVGVALGVAAVIAMADVSASVLASFRHTVDTVAGDAQLEVTAPIGSFDGGLALMDLPAAQRLLGHQDRVDRIAIKLAPGADPEEVRTAMVAALGPAVEVAPPEARGQQAETLLFALRTMLAMMSACAVIVGTLIVYHTVAVSVQQRRRQFALLNAAGIGRRTLVILCLVETVVLALVGIGLGVGMGRLLGLLGSGIVVG